MIYQISTLLEAVRTVMAHNMTSTQLSVLDDPETLSLDTIIASRLVDASRRVEQSAPLSYLETGHNFGDNLYWEQGDDRSGCGWTLLPSDFMRLIAFQMSDWEQPVFSAISPTDSLYRQQHSRYAGIRGTPSFPVCALSVRPEGKVLEFFSSKDTTSSIIKAIYVPEPSISSDESIDISERCYPSIVYMAASLSFAILGEAEKSRQMEELSRIEER